MTVSRGSGRVSKRTTRSAVEKADSSCTLGKWLIFATAILFAAITLFSGARRSEQTPEGEKADFLRVMKNWSLAHDERRDEDFLVQSKQAFLSLNQGTLLTP